MRRWGVRIAALASPLVLVLVLFEAGLRAVGYSPAVVNPINSFNVRDGVLGHRGRPNFRHRFTQPDFDIEVETDSEGFRKPLRPRAPVDRQPRILVFGDSFTWGWGVGQGQVFTDHLADALPGYEVKNLGISGVGTVVEFRLFETGGFAARLRPGDVVVVMFFRNDLEDNVRGSLAAELHGDRVVLRDVDLAWSERLDRVRRTFYLVNFVANRVERVLKTRRATSLARLGPDASSARIARHYLAGFQAVCRERGARFLVVGIPDRALYGEGVVDRPTLDHATATHGVLLSLTRELGIETLDLLPVFRDAITNDRDLRVTFPHDDHWNADGHRLVARVLAEHLGGSR